MKNRNTKVDAYVDRAARWQDETRALREILLDCGLSEDLKWGKPCYGWQGSNVAIIQGFKGFCALLFFKGALLKDPSGVLVSQGANTQSALRVEFTGPGQVAAMEAVLKDLIAQAISVEQAGLKVDYKASRQLEFPDELVAAFDRDPDLRDAFEDLTAGRQRAYVMHFAGAKQAATRTARIAAQAPRILAGKGMNDR